MGRLVSFRNFDKNVGGGVDRDKLARQDFVFWENGKGVFPIKIPQDVKDAVSSWGRYKGSHTFAEFKTRLSAICKRKGAKFVSALPAEWKGKAKTAKMADTDEAAEDVYSFDEIRQMLTDAVNEKTGVDPLSDTGDNTVWIRDIYDSYFVYCKGYDGDLFQCDYTLKDDGTIELGKSVEVSRKTTYVPVASAESNSFSAPLLFSDGGLLVREGPVFEIDVAFPDKHNFMLSEAEADQAIEDFTPVPLDIEHTPSIFQGDLGALTRIWRSGKKLYGAVEVPDWVDKPWGRFGRKVSTAWDVATKKLIGCGLVLNPRVKTAALMAEFADTYRNADRMGVPHTAGDERTMRTLLRTLGDLDLLDESAQPAGNGKRRGNVALKKKPLAGQKARQTKGEEAARGLRASRFADERVDEDELYEEEDDEDTEQEGVIDEDEESEAEVETPVRQGVKREEKRTPAYAKTGAKFARSKDPRDREIAELKRQVVLMSEQNEARAQRERLASCEAWIAGLKADGKITPLEIPLARVAFAQALVDDEDETVLTFAVGKKEVEGGRTDVLKRIFDLRQADIRLRETVEAAFNDSLATAEDAEMDADLERVRKYAEQMNGSRGVKSSENGKAGKGA